MPDETETPPEKPKKPLKYEERLKLEAGKFQNLVALSIATAGLVASGVMRSKQGGAFVFGMGISAMGIALGSIKTGADEEMKMEKLKIEFEEKTKEKKEEEQKVQQQEKQEQLFSISNPASMPGQLFSGSVIGQYY